MKLNMALKILIGTLLMCIICVGVLAPLIYVFSREYSNLTIATSNDVSRIAAEKIDNAFIDMAQVAMKEIATDVARSLSDYIKENPKTLEEYSNDEAFRNIAIRQMFTRGYTSVIEPETYYDIAHPIAEYNKQYIYRFPGYDAEIYKPLMRIVDRANTEDNISDVYKFINSEGLYEDKFTYTKQIFNKTKDGKSLILMATAFNKDFTKKSSELNSILNQRLIESSVDADTKGQWFIFSTTLVIIFVFMVAVLFASIFSRRISRPLIDLADSCRNIARGNFDVKILEVKGSDEISELSKSVENMRQSLNKQSELIKKQTALVDERARELEEALDIAESRTKKILNIGKKE